MQPIYFDDMESAERMFAWQQNGYDAGPLLQREDPFLADFYSTFLNPMWEHSRPQIIRFSDYLTWYEPIDYKATLNWLFHKKKIGVGRMPGALYAPPEFYADCVTVQRSFLTRIDETSFCHDVIVAANIHAFSCGRTEPMTEWYRFRTIRTVDYGLAGELEVTVYDPNDRISGWAMLDTLTADISLDDAANAMLAKYYDKALRQPCRINAYELADNMGYTVQEAFLSADSHIRGRVVFEGMDLTLFDPVTGTSKPHTIRERTILIDPASNQGTRRNFTEDSIVHECCHIFLHQPFLKMQLIHRENMEEAGLDCDLETILHEDSDNADLCLVERQARAMTPRILMPAAQTSMLACQFRQENDRIYHNPGRAEEKTISQTAAFFGTSKESTRNRLKELGDRDAAGVLVYCNGHYLPRHFWSKPLDPGESYSIERDALTELMERDPVLRSLISYEVFLYAEGFVCINDPQYVTTGKWGRKLTSRALKDVSRCCLLFTVHKEYGDNEFTYGVLNSIDKRGMAHVEFDISSVASILEEASIAKGIRRNLPDEFLETLEGYIRAHNISKNQLASVTTMDADRLSNIRRNKVKNITLEEVVVLGIGLGLQPEEIDDLVEKSPAKYDRSERCTIIRILTRRLYQYPVTTFNEAMIACGQEPLTYAS